jgi:hypothetical protein
MKSAAFLIVALLCVQFEASACECDKPAFEKSLEEAAIVFSGTVAGIDETETRLVVHFQPVQVWKGTSVEKLQVETALSTAQCGYSFTSGKRYLVYAGGDAKMLSVNQCSRTSREEDAAEDLERLVRFKNSQQRNLKKPKTLTIFYAVVMGITKTGNEYIALIKGADGAVYTMRSGDALYDGKIARIDRNSVTFVRKSGGHVRKKLHVVPEP